MTGQETESLLIDALDQLTETRDLVEVAFMAADVAGTRKQACAMSRLLGVIADQLVTVNGMVETAIKGVSNAV